jgi:hypothetical protein
MHDIQADRPEHDPLADLLRPPTPPADGEALRQALREQTTRRVRRRGRLRLLARVAALAACYLAGLATAHLPRPAPRPAERAAPRAAVPPDAVALEWRALEGGAGRARRYREAGDRYLDQSDPESALRCYGAALDEEDGDGAVTAGDSWLLMAIRQARQKEKDDAKKGD